MTPAEIQAARKRLGLNTTDFGARLLVSGRTIEDWEGGRHKPRGLTLAALHDIAKEQPAKAKP